MASTSLHDIVLPQSVGEALLSDLRGRCAGVKAIQDLLKQ